jgi:phosphotriesterase-related protein
VTGDPMGVVTTVAGVIDPDDLGRSLVHEHFFFGYPGHEGDRTMWTYDEQAILDAARSVSRTTRAYGVRTVFDLTPSDCGRDVRLLKEISQRHDIQIVATSGYYEGGASYLKFRSLFNDTVKELTELFVTELTDGVEGTGIRTGLLKVATGAGEITEYEKATFQAAAAAQQLTGTPIFTHTSQGTMGPEQARLLLEAGADPAKVVIGHMCERSHDVQYQLDVLKQGVGIAFDRIGGNRLFNDVTDDDRMDMVVNLMDRGFGDRIFLSHDSVNHWKGRDASAFQHVPGAEHWGIHRIGEYVIPSLLERGLSENDVDGLVRDNVQHLWKNGA